VIRVDGEAMPVPPGRNAEIVLLERFLTEARTGGSLLLTGEPGIGLTTLLDVAADRATDSAAGHGYRVVRADPADRERDRGRLSGLRRLLRPLTAELSAIAAPHETVLQAVLDPQDAAVIDPIKVAVALLNLLRALPGRPVLVILDDADHLDPTGYDVLDFVADRLSGTGVAMLIAAHRQFTAGPNRRTSGHEVPPLTAATAREFLRHRYPELCGAVTERVLAEAAGNPLALREMPAALTVSERAGACPLPFGPPLTDRLRDTWAPHLSGLPVATRHLLLLAAVDDVGTLDRLGRLEADTSLAVLSAAEEVGVVRVTAGGVLTFAHPLLRATVVNLATPQQRSQAHRAWAAVLIDEPEARAWHLAHAHVQPDDEIAEQLEGAARQARIEGDLDAATAGLVRAAELSSTNEQRGRRWADAAYLAARAGRGFAATELLVRAETADPRIRQSLRAATVTSLRLLLQEGLPAAHRQLSDAVAAVAEPDDETRFDAVRLLCLLSALGGDPDAWRRTEEAVARLRTPIPADLAMALTVVHRALGRPADLTAVDQAIAALQPTSSWHQVMWTAHIAMLLNRAEDGRAAVRRFPSTPFTVDALGVQTLFLQAHCQLAAGEWRSAEETLTTPGLAHWFRPRGSNAATSPLGALEAYLAALQGDHDRAGRLADEAEAWAGPCGVAQILWTVAQTRAATASARGDFEEAYRQLCAITPPGEPFVGVGTPVHVVLELVEAAVRTDRKDAARAHLARFRAARIDELSHPQRLLVTAARALVAETEVEAVSLFEAALAEPSADGRPFDQARVQLLFGEQQRRVHQPQRARTLLATARDTFTGLGARPWADRAAEELRAAGHSTPTRHPVAAVLNEQERRIAELGAAGLTNKEIGIRLWLSPRTVGNVLHRIYPKLAITSRAGLSDALAARTGGP
jgi:DNA-binding CsgD family transcriptional regulator